MIGFYHQIATTWTPDSVTRNWNTVGVSHDFSPYAGRIVHMRYNGNQSALYLNKVDNLHYGTAYVDDGESVTIDVDDPNTGELLRVVSSSLDAPVEPTAVRTRYVSPTGSGSTYSEGVPGDLKVALSNPELTTGDHIILLDGTYNNTQLSCQASALNVVIKAHTGATPIIDGWQYGSFPTWTEQTSDVWSVSASEFGTTKQCHANLSGTIQRLAYQNTFAELAAKDYGWSIDGGQAYVKLNGANPNSNQVYIGVLAPLASADNGECLWLRGNGTQLKGIIIQGHSAGTNATTDGVRVDADDVYISDCIIRYVHGRGIRVTGASRVLIENVQCIDERDHQDLDDMKMDNPTREPNYRTELSSQLHLTGTTSCTVRDCTLSGLGDSIRIQDSSGSVVDLNVHDSTITKSQASAIDVDGLDHSQIRIWRVTGDRTLSWLSMALADSGGPYIWADSHFSDWGYVTDAEITAPTDTSLAATKFNGSGTGPVGAIMCINCTVSLPYGSLPPFTILQAWRGRDFLQGDCYLKNCIIESNDDAFIEDQAGGEYDIADNIISTTSTGSGHYRWEGVLETASDFTAASGCSTINANLDPVTEKPTIALPGVYVHGYTHNPYFGKLPAEMGYHQSP